MNGKGQDRVVKLELEGDWGTRWSERINCSARAVTARAVLPQTSPSFICYEGRHLS